MASTRRARKRGHGEGNVYQRKDGYWVARLMVGYKPNGKPDRRAVYAKTRAEVQRRLLTLRQQLDSGLVAQPQRVTVGDYLTQWLRDSVAPSVRPRTHASYAQVVRLYLQPGLGRYRLADLRPQHIQQLYVSLLARGLSARTARYCHALLHRALALAVKWGLVTRNVTEAVDQPALERKETPTLTDEEVARLLSVTADTDIEALLALAVATGARQGELLGLKWDDVDRKEGTITIRRSLVRVRNGNPTYSEPKTPKSRRMMVVPRFALEIMRQHRVRQLETRLQAGRDYNDAGIVFAAEIGTHMAPRTVVKKFKAFLSSADLPQALRFHDLRHTNATLLTRWSRLFSVIEADWHGHWLGKGTCLAQRTSSETGALSGRSGAGEGIRTPTSSSDN